MEARLPSDAVATQVLPSGLLRVVLVGALGSALAVLFHQGVLLPRNAGIVVLLTAAALGIKAGRLSQMSLLPRFMIVVYTLPFTALTGYLLSDRFIWTTSARAFTLSQEPLLLDHMLAVGLIGLVGLITGILAAGLKPGPHTVQLPRIVGRTLAVPAFAILLSAAVFFSWLSAPPETIFQGAYAYGQSASAAGRVNFPAAFLLSYVLLIALAIDTERESDAGHRRLKVVFFVATVSYIVIVLQLLRGDRESSGLLAALTAIYLTSPRLRAGADAARVSAMRLRRLILPGSLALAFYVALGGVRGMFVVGAGLLSPLQAFQYGLTMNTWTAVLWTNLGTAWEYRSGLMTYKLGETYLNYLLSLPPGVITQLFGYVRPIQLSDLSLESLFVSAGGLHIAITPFKNFGAIGVFLILAIYGYLIGRIEINNSRGALRWRLLWGATFASAFLWFWYGDMSYVRGLMLTAVVYFLYRVALSARLYRPIARRS